MQTLIVTLLLTGLVGCDDSDSPISHIATKRAKALVIVPADQRDIYRKAAEWALANIESAQQGLPTMATLDLEWLDEADPSIAASVRDRLSRGDVDFVIGPIRSARAELVAPVCVDADIPLILPSATSTELQRIYAGTRAVWNLTQSDISQCEVLLTQAKLSDVTRVELITTSDDYGRSFSDWLPYQAVELGLKVDRVTIYNSPAQLREAVLAQAAESHPWSKAIIFAPADPDDAVTFDSAVGELRRQTSGPFSFPLLLCSDIVNNRSLAARLSNLRYEGIAPCASPESGFISAYKSKFGSDPALGEAHIYDALALAAFAVAARVDDENLNETILRLVDGRDDCAAGWLPADMHRAFRLIADGGNPDLDGASGDWTFDSKSHASVLNTTYAHWILADGVFTTLEYLSTDGSRRTTSTIQAWDSQTNGNPGFSDPAVDPTYPDLHDRWAVVIATSDTWPNYRHQADALAMYQLLKRHGYDDDHIILVMEDNLVYDPHNIHPGEVRVRPDGENLHHDVDVDYKLSDLTMADLKNIMLGRSSARLPRVLSSSECDNVLVFWCGHGNYGRLAWGKRDIDAREICDILAEMSVAGNFRKILFSIDACYSGSIGETCTGIPGVLFLTAANARETSKADMKDSEMGIWLSNGFTRAFQETIDETPAISLRDLYYSLARHTVGSHATIYNAENFGNLSRNSMSEFLR